MLVDESDLIDLMDKGLVLLLIFYGLVFIFIIGQYELKKLNKKVEYKYLYFVVMIEEVFIVILGMFFMLFWCVVYLIYLSFVFLEYYKVYLWMFYVIGFIGVCVM